MSVQFILGRSGTGKTSYCIREIIDALLAPRDEPLILLVPEQATYQAERAILSDERIAGYHRLNVLSFDRLQFMLLGRNTARPALSRIGRQMIVHRILHDKKSKLQIFSPSADQPGLSREMASIIDELHKYAKTPDDIDRLLGELAKDEKNNLSVLKFTDIGLVLKEYLKFVENDFYDPDAQVRDACEMVPTVDFARGAKLWVDGFAGFTDAELALLIALLKTVTHAKIAFCLDPSSLNLSHPDINDLDPLSLFAPTEQTYCHLIEIIQKNGLSLFEPIVLRKAMRFSTNQALAHIEQNLFRHKPPKLKSADDIHIISAPNERREVRFVVRQILRLVREKNYRYRDIAVIASDIDRYVHYIRAYFDDYNIPFFIDMRKPLNQHPLVQLICSSLQAVISGFSNSDLFTCLKTDLVPVERCDVDLLENYCIAFGISSNDWQNTGLWQFAGAEDEDFNERKVNQIRQKVINPLLVLKEKLCPDSEQGKKFSAEQFTQVVFDYLDSLDIKQTIGTWIASPDLIQENITTDEHQQLYNKLVDIFDEIVEVFGDRTMRAEDFLAVLKSAFSQLTLAFIPPTLDEVLVGSIERSRHPDLKAVFLIGATQKQFPVPVGPESILSDDDREAVERAEFSLAATKERTLVDRRYLAYIAMTRPSELLYLTYPSVDDKGSDIPRSQFVSDVELLFENLGQESIAGQETDIENIYTESELAELLCERLGKDSFSPAGNDNGKFVSLLNQICSDKQFDRLGEDVCEAIEYDNCASLGPDVVADLFESEIKSSATRLSTFAACPYRHFARYLLELKERREFKLEPLDIGNFYHGILDALLKRLITQSKSFATIDDQELVKLLKEQIEIFIRENAFLSHFVARRGYNEYIVHSASEDLERCVLAIAQMVRAGDFRPALSEVSFGPFNYSRDTIGKYEIALTNGRVLSLSGKIDRLDFAGIDGETVAIVLDYKRSSTIFNWSRFYYGLDIQLPMYMLAIRNADGKGGMDPVGAFYIPIEVNPQNVTFDKLADKSEKFNYKAKGIFDARFAQNLDSNASGDSKFYNFYVTKDGQPYGSYANRGALKPEDFQKVLEFAEHKIIKLAEEIISGKIDITPYRLNQQSPCSFCEYGSVCRFDWQINDYNVLGTLNKIQVLEKAGGLDG